MRYYGGKWRIAPQIVALFPPHEVYVDAFGGGASVLLRKQRATCEVYNDIDADVVNVFRVLRDDGERLATSMMLTPYARDEYWAAYEMVEDPIERARLFLFRTTAGIGSNSSWRKNGFRTSLCDVRHSTAVSWANLPAHVPSIAERFRGVIIENRDACKVMGQYDADHTLHYLDPPYLSDTRKHGKGGYSHEMSGEAEHLALLEFAKTLRGKVVVSGYASPVYDEQLQGWRKVNLRGGRDQSNERRPETVWLNFNISEDLFGL